MRRAAVARARLWVGAVACAGVAFSHGIAYRLVAPDAPRRAELLDTTGHRYFALVVAAALVALVVGLGDFVAESIASRGQAIGPRKLFYFAAGRLTALQAAGFVVLEALERLAGGEHHFASAVLAEPATLLGIALQLLSALIAALILVALRRIIVQVRAIRRPTGHSSATSWNTRVAEARLTAVAGEAAARAPPLRFDDRRALAWRRLENRLDKDVTNEDDFAHRRLAVGGDADGCLRRGLRALAI